VAGRQGDLTMCDKCESSEAAVHEGVLRRRFLKAAGGIAASLVLAKSGFAKDQKPPPKPQNEIAPAAALKRLMEGNARYVAGKSLQHDFKREREALVGGQNPYAAILSCADSRIAPEYAFDSGRGDLFVCRVAGNFGNAETVASLEYAVAVLNTPLLFVLGHDSCGAVDATIKSLKDNTTLPGHLPSLVEALAPSVKASADQPGDKLANAIRQNVLDTVAKLKAATPILKAAVDEGKINIVGGIYRLTDGKVEMVA
jgi:carbonic anhydrase